MKETIETIEYEDDYKPDFIDLITHNPNKRYSRCLNKVGRFRDGIDKIYTQYYDATKKRIARLKDGQLYQGKTKEELKINLSYNKKIMNQARGMIANYFASSKRYLPAVDIQLLLRPSPLRDIIAEGERLKDGLDNMSKDTADTLELITNKKVKAKVVKLLSELDLIEDNLRGKARTLTEADGFGYLLQQQLKGDTDDVI